MTERQSSASFFGWQVTWAAFVVAVFGWGIGFYGPPVFLYTIEESRGWSIGLISAAVTTHFLWGAFIVANMPAIYRRFGLPAVTKISAACLALGVLGWALAQEPWQLFTATLLSGLGWAGTGALAINMIVAPWFERRRPAALSLAYNGASVGGVLFSPLWVALIGVAGFAAAAVLIGMVMVAVLWVLSNRYFAIAPADLGMRPDGGETPATGSLMRPEEPILSGHSLWVNRGFLTYTAGFVIGLFVQVGIIAHLFSLLVPAMGAYGAGVAAGFATACAIAGRTLMGWLLPQNADRRVVAAATYAVQACGCASFIFAEGQSLALLLLGVALFGIGIGNVTSLPPLIAHAEFSRADVPRAIALATAIGQATYSFAPAVFGGLREWAPGGGAAGDADVPVFFIVAATGQMLAAAVYLMGRRGKRAG